jgi:hypothetical protein
MEINILFIVLIKQIKTSQNIKDLIFCMVFHFMIAL